MVCLSTCKGERLIIEGMETPTGRIFLRPSADFLLLWFLHSVKHTGTSFDLKRIKGKELLLIFPGDQAADTG